MQAVAPQKPRCGATVCVKRKSICVLVITHERAANVCILYVLVMYLNNVLSCCTHNICIYYNGENYVGPDSRHVPLSYFIPFRIHCQ